jgi:iron complex outermembrane receptor protein
VDAVLKTVEIRANRESETRRLSTAAKTVVGREEIERYGDSSMGELLKRLPGIISSGRPGRGGPPALRGLGNGYTQIMIDGERAPRGFSLEDMLPEQVERIEIMRSPTAETGARAIAGTINIITREGFRIRLNDLRVGLGTEGGEPLGEPLRLPRAARYVVSPATRTKGDNPGTSPCNPT